MVPVRLKLRNFLSYGEGADALDFTDFHVACLSGGNGQGKSALLDAITWAIWGEARKSGDQRKPDEEILRIGARDMEVDLTFDLDGTRYRVVRSYQQSASGKTSKPGLEVQVLDPDTSAYTPLTAGSVRATQAVIDERLGIDYETFINSTFLLQGRSDEFTRKKPSERKEILGKILGLGRYEALSARAAARWSALRERANALESESERLTVALEPVGRWTEERDAVGALLDEVQAELARVDAELAAVTETLAGLDAADREATTLREGLAALATQTARLTSERDRLVAQIETAQTLVADADAIEAANARYETLRAERKALDDRATLHRGVEAQIHTLDLDERRAQAEADARSVQLGADVEQLDRQIREDTARVGSRDELVAKLERAQAATAQATRLGAVRQKREAAETRLRGALTRLDAERARLTERRDALQASIQDAAQTAAPDDDALARLERAVSDAQSASKALNGVREQGAGVTAQIKAVDDRRKTRVEALAQATERRERILSAREDDCPTCGTPLTPEHRRTVAAEYDAEIASLESALSAIDAEHAELQARRKALLGEYARIKPDAERADSVRDELSRARAARDQAEQRARALAADRARLVEVRVLLDDDTFAPDVRDLVRQAEAEVASLAFDREAYERALADGAGLARLRDDLRAVETAAARLTELTSRRDAARAALDAHRAALDAGTHLEAFRERRTALRAQLDQIGYDAGAHERASRDLDALSDAPTRQSRLLDARRNLADWTERRAETSSRIAEAEAERGRRDARLAELAASLEGRRVAQESRRALSERRAELDRRRAEALARRGGLDERLAAAAQDREALAGVKRDLRDAKSERALYGHLKRAFGRHGIPSLIIEETLPEVEDRANALLDRLTDGRTRVRLETLKDKKTGGTKETLDIRITDAQGVARAYETFSGGEAFRVNFALRIALSQMLAERSGRQIRTLVIDEGFGTQDQQGLHSLIGAIRAVQDDFDKVIVITHLDELKSAFPVRIEVTKKPVVGSTIEVLGV